MSVLAVLVVAWAAFPFILLGIVLLRLRIEDRADAKQLARDLDECLARILSDEQTTRLALYSTSKRDVHAAPKERSR